MYTPSKSHFGCNNILPDGRNLNIQGVGCMGPGGVGAGRNKARAHLVSIVDLEAFIIIILRPFDISFYYYSSCSDMRCSSIV
jgi:hypothetical protein